MKELRPSQNRNHPSILLIKDKIRNPAPLSFNEAKKRASK